MTWNHKTTDDGSKMRVWDHNAVAGDAPLQTVPLETPRTRNDEQVVLDVMFDAAVTAYQDAGGTVDDYVLRTLADAAFEQIERGEP